MFEFSIDQTPAIALALLWAWLAGMRVYLTVLFVGLAGAWGWMALPPALHATTSAWLIAACALLALVEFVVDKIPGVDGGWDLLHTLVRVPVGAVLGAAMLSRDGHIGAETLLAGGAVTLGSHLIRSKTRTLINTSPEPLSNWSASLAEDLLCVAALALAMAHPCPGLGIAVAGSVLIAAFTRWSFRDGPARQTDQRKEAMTPCS